MNKHVSNTRLYLTVVTVVTFIVANIISVKQFSVLGVTFDVGAVIFPISYVVSDVFSEVYGYKESRRVNIIAIIANIFVVAVFAITAIIPPAEHYQFNDAYRTIMLQSPRILLASMLGAYIGDFTNDIVFKKMKENDKGNYWIRSILSSLPGQFTDSSIFVPVAFAGIMPLTDMLIMVLTSPVVKLLTEIIFSPFATMFVKFIKKQEAKEMAAIK